MRVHLSKDAVWRACRPRIHECALPVHLDDFTVAEARALPEAFMRPLLDTLLPPDDVEADGTLVWRDGHGQLHRDYDLPAVVRPGEYGIMEWRHHGQLHRGNDKPARVFADGDLHWFVNGFRHREDGKPAVIAADGMREWYTHGSITRQEED